MSNSYNIYDIDALVIWNVIKANTVCVKVYLLFLTCNMTNPSKKELTNRNRGRPPLWDYSPKHWTPVGSFLHAHCEDYIYSDNFVKYWHLMQKSLIFFWINNTFFSHNHVQFYCHSLFLSSFILPDFEPHHTKTATETKKQPVWCRPTRQPLFAVIYWWFKNLLADTLEFYVHCDGFSLNTGSSSREVALVVLSITWSSSAESAKLPWNWRCWDFWFFWAL